MDYYHPGMEFGRSFNIGPDEILSSIGGFLALLAIIGFIAWLVFLVFYTWMWYRVYTKAGFSGSYAFLYLIPVVGPLITLAYLSFSDWPHELIKHHTSYTYPDTGKPQAPVYAQPVSTPSETPAPKAPVETETTNTED